MAKKKSKRQKNKKARQTTSSSKHPPITAPLRTSQRSTPKKRKTTKIGKGKERAGTVEVDNPSSTPSTSQTPPADTLDDALQAGQALMASLLADKQREAEQRTQPSTDQDNDTEHFKQLLTHFQTTLTLLRKRFKELAATEQLAAKNERDIKSLELLKKKFRQQLTQTRQQVDTNTNDIKALKALEQQVATCQDMLKQLTRKKRYLDLLQTPGHENHLYLFHVLTKLLQGKFTSYIVANGELFETDAGKTGMALKYYNKGAGTLIGLVPFKIGQVAQGAQDMGIEIGIDVIKANRKHKYAKLAGTMLTLNPHEVACDIAYGVVARYEEQVYCIDTKNNFKQLDKLAQGITSGVHAYLRTATKKQHQRGKHKRITNQGFVTVDTVIDALAKFKIKGKRRPTITSKYVAHNKKIKLKPQANHALQTTQRTKGKKKKASDNKGIRWGIADMLLYPGVKLRTHKKQKVRYYNHTDNTTLQLFKPSRYLYRWGSSNQHVGTFASTFNEKYRKQGLEIGKSKKREGVYDPRGKKTTSLLAQPSQDAPKKKARPSQGV